MAQFAQQLRALSPLFLRTHADWHLHHKMLATDQKALATVTEQANTNDELLDAKEASRRMGYFRPLVVQERRFPTIHHSRKDGQAALLQARR
jgi:hypothetical protein